MLRKLSEWKDDDVTVVLDRDDPATDRALGNWGGHTLIRVVVKHKGRYCLTFFSARVSGDGRAGNTSGVWFEMRVNKKTRTVKREAHALPYAEMRPDHWWARGERLMEFVYETTIERGEAALDVEITYDCDMGTAGNPYGSNDTAVEPVGVSLSEIKRIKVLSVGGVVLPESPPLYISERTFTSSELYTLEEVLAEHAAEEASA